ncbi:MAG: CpsB/CapC family capsule biosynthesis tyrosine phosphatase, partial [Myxococcota bacterium]
MIWFRKKKTLPEGMVDLHNHVLPGIDDGALDWESSLEMMRAYERMGFSTIAATPHRCHPLFPKNVTEQGIHVLVEEAQYRASDDGLSLRVLPGAEYYFSDLFFSTAERAELLSLGGECPFVLLEFPTQHPMTMMKDLVFRLQVQGIRPVLAHPERYLCLHHAPQKLREWHDAGWFFQLDLPSIVGET